MYAKVTERVVLMLQTVLIFCKSYKNIQAVINLNINRTISNVYYMYNTYKNI